jgi:hypothetical protein
MSISNQKRPSDSSDVKEEASREQLTFPFQVERATRADQITAQKARVTHPSRARARLFLSEIF